jgi:putative ABC transport system permease protein
MKIFRSDIVENLWLALNTLRSNKMRSFLTIIGVIIGVVTVMLIASIISGIDTAFTKEVESFGTRSMYISKYNRHSRRPPFPGRAHAKGADLR